MTTRNKARCERCRFWTRQPDHVYQPTEWQKPVGPPQVTRYGVCSRIDHRWITPAEDGIATNESHCSEGSDTTTTGINFGCVHHEERD
jgi:hypothetical protein